MPKTKLLFILFLFFLTTLAYGKTANPITVNAIITETNIIFSPPVIPENTPFVLHVINQTSAPVELENTDTSVEVYSGTDKTFKIGLTAGSYTFFNDFNARVKPASLLVKTQAEFEKESTATSVPIHHSITPTANNLSISSILFIIWRESVEALLVVGIVYSWLKQLKENKKSGMIALWVGVAIGLLFAVLLSIVLVDIKNALPASFSNYFQASMAFIACLMIVYMVKWMRTNSRKIKAGMHHSLEKSHSQKWRNISIASVVAIAFAREASEAVIFVYALGLNNHAEYSPFRMAGFVALGVALAIATIYLLQLGNKIFSWKFFFKITEILLLLLGGGLLLNTVDLLISSGFLPVIYTHVWDTSFILSDGGFFAPIVSSFTGYRASPSLMNIIAYGMYWGVIYVFLMHRKTQNKT